MRLFLIIVLLVAAGCADLSPQTRWRHADELGNKAGWQKLRIPAETFVLSAYVPEITAQSDTLTVYIEGDGLAWLSRSQPSNDPTPRHPLGLELALRHPQGAAVYLARPCQFVEAADARNCRQTYWTDRRFADEVITATDLAITELKRRFGARKLMLVGYSGGGAVAALVAARRNDVIRLVTVAGNLDHRAWTEMHRVQALAGSLNAADAWRALASIPQRHFVGGSDQIVSRAVADSYAGRFPPGRKPEIVVVPNFDHACCWVDAWPELLSDGYLTEAGAGH